MIEQHRSYPYEKYGFGIILHPLLEETVGDVKASLWILMASVGLVLLIACANMANLLLVRSSERQQEIETRRPWARAAWRLARQLLTESVASRLIGGLVGLAVTPLVLAVDSSPSHPSLCRVRGAQAVRRPALASHRCYIAGDRDAVWTGARAAGGGEQKTLPC